MIGQILSAFVIVGLAILAYGLASVALAFGLRHLTRWPVFQRLNDANWRRLTLIDEAAASLIFPWLYVLGLYPRKPMVGDTISSLAWAGELQGVRWCGLLRRAIDKLFRVLTSQEHHCRKAFENWANPLEKLS